MSQKIVAILLMAGVGKRFAHSLPKQFVRLSGRPIYLYALDTFLDFAVFHQILLVCPKGWIAQVQQEVAHIHRVRVIAGGSSRQESTYLALQACPQGTQKVVLHDGVRPLVSHQIISSHLEALQHFPAIDTCLPVSDTVICSNNQEQVASIPDRTKLMLGQTPQSFTFDLLLRAHRLSQDKQRASDDCSLVLPLTDQMQIVQGCPTNLKITTQIDLLLAEQLLLRKLGPELSAARLDQFQGKQIAITGGTGGIGKAIASKLSQIGATPLVISRTAPRFRVDLTSFEQTQKLFNRLYQECGPLDGLINCVGALIINPLAQLTSDQIDHLIASNLHTLIYSCRCARLQDNGHIVNLSSSSSFRGRPSYALYSSTKAAVINLTQALAEEHPNLCINAVVPQRTDTPLRRTHFPQDPPGSLLSPQQVADQILTILSQRTITGSTFFISRHQKDRPVPQ